MGGNVVVLCFYHFLPIGLVVRKRRTGDLRADSVNANRTRDLQKIFLD
jgi:hypothetical protein